MEIEFCKPQDADRFLSLCGDANRENALKLLYEKKTEKDMMEMMQILIKNHIHIQRSELLEPNLEDLFMEVVGR